MMITIGMMTLIGAEIHREVLIDVETEMACYVLIMNLAEPHMC